VKTWKDFIWHVRNKKLAGWGITTRQKIVWTWLYAQHLGLFPGRWFWRLLVPLFAKNYIRYCRSIESVDGFWVKEDKDGD